MPRSYPFSHTCHGRHVGFSLIKRKHDRTYTLYFRGPDDSRRKRDTNQTGIERAKEAATAVIDKEYVPTAKSVIVAR